MKKLLLILVTLTFLLNCDRKTKKIEPVFIPKTETKSNTETSIESKTDLKLESEKIDTTVVYWTPDIDTIIEIKDLKIKNEIHKLEIRTYSINDSAVIRINDLNKPIIYKDIYHNYVSDISLKKGTEIILKTQINKQTFIDSLDGEFLKHSVMKIVEFDTIISDNLSLKGYMNVPDTGWLIKNDIEIGFEGENKGTIRYGNFKDIGN